MNSISPILNLMIKACEKASKVIIRDFGELENLQVSRKGPKDFVTKTDKRVEKILMDELPIIPIYTYTRIFMKHESVQGWNPNLLDSHAYQYISISDK